MLLNTKLSLTLEVWEQVYRRFGLSEESFRESVECGSRAWAARWIDVPDMLVNALYLVHRTHPNLSDFAALAAQIRELGVAHFNTARWVGFWAPIQNHVLEENWWAAFSLGTAFGWDKSPQGQKFWEEFAPKLRQVKQGPGLAPKLRQVKQDPEVIAVHRDEAQIASGHSDELWWQREDREKTLQKHRIVAMRNEVRAMISGNMQFHDDELGSK